MPKSNKLDIYSDWAHLRWLRLFIVSTIVLGVFFRCFNLDLKVFWVDEVISTHYAFGYTEAEIGNQVKDWNGQAISIRDLHKVQSPSPEKRPIDTVRALATEEPQSPPLYYLLLKWWSHLFGNSVGVRRSLSACFSLLAFPCLYWLSRELFQSPLTSWISMALFAVSPFHIIYAQEARYYAAWTTTILLSSAALLWAIRTQRTLAWFAYTLALIVGLYTYTFTIILAISHGMYVALTNKFKINKTTIRYLFSLLIGMVAFAPWSFFIITSSSEMSTWRQTKVSLLTLAKSWISCLEIAFWDFHKTNLRAFAPGMPFLLALCLKGALLVLIGYIFFYLIRKTSQEIWLFILALVLVPWLILAIPDLITGGIRSTIPRYLASSYLGIQLATAYFFANKINPATDFRQRRVWQFVFCLMMSISLVSGAVFSQSKIWWNKANNIDNPAIAKIINQTDNALVIGQLTGDDGRSIISLSYSLKPAVRLQLIHSKLEIPEIPSRFTNVFLYSLPDEIKAEIEKQNYQTELVYHGRRWLEELKR